MDSTIIDKVSIYKMSIPLKEPFVTSLGPEYKADNIVVVITTKSGLRGVGECSPFMLVNGESQDTGFLVGQYLARGLKTRDAADVAANHRVMDAIIYGNSSIKSAFDIAMYDISAQAAGVPLYQLIGGRKGKKIIIDYTVSLDTVDEMVKHAIDLKRAGFSILKIKLGGDPDTDIERAAAIRGAVGETMTIRIDANQGWKFDDAVRALQGMKDLQIQYCEEPIARWNWMRLKEIKKRSPIPIMADESCFDEHDARRLIQTGSCDMFNLKMGKSAGIYRALKIIRLAEENGMEMQTGGFLESRIGMTAIAHLALVSDNIQYFDMDTPLMFSEDPVSGGMIYRDGGEVVVPESPGLGAFVDDTVLRRLPSITI